MGETTMGEIQSRIVNPCRCQDLRCQDKCVQQRRLRTRVPAGHLGSSGIESAAINHNQDKLQTKVETSWFLKRVSAWKLL